MHVSHTVADFRVMEENAPIMKNITPGGWITYTPPPPCSTDPPPIKSRGRPLGPSTGSSQQIIPSVPHLAAQACTFLSLRLCRAGRF